MTGNSERLKMVSVSHTTLLEVTKTDKHGKLIILAHEVDEDKGTSEYLQIRQVLYFAKDGKIHDYTFREEFDSFSKEILGEVRKGKVMSLQDVINFTPEERY